MRVAETCMPIIVDGKRYQSIFEAGTECGVSYVTLALMMKKTNGAPYLVKSGPGRGKLVFLESWEIKKLKTPEKPYAG